MDGLLSLLEATEYEGMVIKEWNIVQFAKLTRTLSQIAKEYKEKNVAWDGFLETLGKAESGGMLDLSQGFLEFIAPFIEHAPTILSVSCGVDGKKLETLKYTDGIIAVMLVLKANLEHLNRFFVKLVAAPAEVATTVSTQ